MEDNQSDKQKIQRIKCIIEKEIEKELVSKQNEVSDISEKIKNVLRNLELLKYVVAVSYYDQNPVLSSKKGQDEDNEEEKSQNQIHPCVKKLLPFRMNYNKSFSDILGSHSYETRNNKKAVPDESVTVEIKKEVDDDTSQKQCDPSNNVKIPRYIPPLPNTDEVTKTVNSTGGSGLMDSYRVVVGNVSKWISPDTREDNSTHKWMVYIRNKDENKDITKLLRKVRYFLHESYKPHDIIDVTSPFQLTRRGWGEFPIRVQLHFIHPLDKPVDIIHNLKLDMTCSGVQMLGAETVVEVSLHRSNLSSAKDVKKQESNSKHDSLSIKEEGLKEKQDVFDGSLLTNINGIKSSNIVAGIKEEEFQADIVIKQEPEDNFENKNFLTSKHEEINLAISNSRKFLLDRRKAMKIIEIEHNYLGVDEYEFDKSFNTFTKSVLKLETGKNHNVDKICKNGAVFESSNFNQVFSKKNQDRLNKIELSNRSEEEVFKRLKSVIKKLETETQSKYCMKVFRHIYLVNVLQRAQATKLKTVEPLIKWFVQRWPIITKLSLDPVYKTVHPYSCPSEEEFFKYSIGKQRSAEWFRAKAIQKVLKSLKSVIPIEEEIWSTKQILLWSRFHGYFPWFFPENVKSETVEANDVKSKTTKSNESSSDSEDGLDISSKDFQMSNNKFLNGLSVVEKKKNFKKSRKKICSENERIVNYQGCNTCTEVNDPSRFGSNEFRVLQSSADSDVEVVELDNEAVKDKSPIKKRETYARVQTILPNEMAFNKFVCETAREIGVKIVEEEIVSGVKCDSVSRVLSQSVSCFLDELVRRSFARGWTRNGDRCPESIELNDVLATIIENSRFDIFTNRGLGQETPGKSDI